MSPRGRTFTVVAAVALVVAVVAAVLWVGGRKGLGPLADNGGGNPSHPTLSPPPPLCPLTGTKPEGRFVPNRPALAIKVENLPAARPQTGLSWADIIYEEPVEAGITRFIVVYQCEDASRVEPIRSARLTDPDILDQFGKPVFGYAGGVQKVINKVRTAGLIDVNFIRAAAAYHRDTARPAPHNLYTSTKELYAAAHARSGAPQPIFTYSKDAPTSATPVSSFHIPFSSYSDVVWRWSDPKGAWLRSYGAEPATYSNGVQIGTRNVVIQMVKVVMTDITDTNGVHSPEVIATGSGTCYVLRNGKMIKGTWSRSSLSDVTEFKDAQGNVIALDPGKTWVELVPNQIKVASG
jgi:hypothetical protein